MLEVCNCIFKDGTDIILGANYSMTLLEGTVRRPLAALSRNKAGNMTHAAAEIAV